MAKNYTIEMYDLEDNYIKSFKNYKECAEYFSTTPTAIITHICRSKTELNYKKRDIKRKQWVKIYKMNYDEEMK